MKAILLAGFALLTLLNSAMAQTPAYKKCCGTKSTQFPFKNVTSRKTQLWYNPGDFTAPAPISGFITKIYFVSQTAGQSGTFDDLTVLLKQPAATNTGFTGTTFETGMTQAYFAASTTVTGASVAGGWYAITLTTPFLYDASKPLVVEINYSNPALVGGLDNLGTDAVVPPNKKLYAATIAATTGTTSNGFWQDFGFDIGTPCIAPAGLNATNIISTGATVSWNAVPSSGGYEYAVDQNAAGPASGISTNNLSEPVSGLIANTNYYLHVRNICAANTFSGWTNYAFTTPLPFCQPPGNVLFSNVKLTSADMLWTKMPNADWYEYAMDIAPKIPPVAVKTTTGITASLTSLQPNTWYYVLVRSICLGGSDNSNWKLDSFITKADCEKPVVSITNPGNNPTASWLPIPVAVAYEWVVRNDNSMPAFGKETMNTSVSLTLPEDHLEKYLHVRTKCNSQFSFSEWVVTPLRVFASNVNDVNSKEAMKAYPNPVTDKLTVEIANAKPGETLIVTDMTGRLIKTLVTGGVNTVIDMEGIAPGIYIIKHTGASSNGAIRITRQ